MVLVGVELMTPGAMSAQEYDVFVRDIANFLDYAGEPVKAKRQSLGVFRHTVLAGGFRVRLLVEKRILEGRTLTQQRDLPLMVLGDRVSGTSLGDDSFFGAD